MLLIVGGASRAGKSIVTHRMLEQHGVPYFSLDFLAMAIKNGMPEYLFEAEDPSIDRAERLWPVVWALCVNIIEAEVPAYTVEGDFLLPAQVRDLNDTFPGQVRACFLGYADGQIEHKLRTIRAHGSSYNDWLTDHDDEYIRDLVREMQEFSRYLRDECARLNIPYFETSGDFTGAMDAAVACLAGARPEVPSGGRPHPPLSDDSARVSIGG